MRTEHRAAWAGAGLDEAYWAMAVTDVEAALTVLAPDHEASDGEDGLVCMALDPVPAEDASANRRRPGPARGDRRAGPARRGVPHRGRA